MFSSSALDSSDIQSREFAKLLFLLTIIGNFASAFIKLMAVLVTIATWTNNRIDIPVVCET